MVGERRQRRDAVANRARIVEAAAQVLREEGMGADMRRIAAASGVGIGTLYRHFPTRDDLVQAVTGTDLAALADAGLPADRTAADALREFFTVAIAQLADNKAMVDVLTAGSPADGDVQRCMAHLTRVGQDAVDRARDDRTLAADVTASDIAYQLVGLARVAQLLPDSSPSTVTRQVELALRGLLAAHPGVPSRPATTWPRRLCLHVPPSSNRLPGAGQQNGQAPEAGNVIDRGHAATSGRVAGLESPAQGAGAFEPKRGVAAAEAEEFVVGAGLGDVAVVVEDDDLVGVHHGGELVGDDDEGGVFAEGLEGALHEPLVLRVERGGGLVQ